MNRYGGSFVFALAAALLSLAGCARSYEVLSHSDGGADMGEGSEDSSVDGGVPPECAPQAAAVAVCTSCGAIGAPTYAWNGERCISFTCGTAGCYGDDCDALYSTESECLSAHSRCMAPLCESTGGVYDAESCGYSCGHEDPCTGLVAVPGCRCEVGKTYDAILGCIADASCGRRDLCLATGGSAHGIGADEVCGSPVEQACATTDSCCHCGPSGIFDEAIGCRPDFDCPSTTEVLCTATGGVYDSIMCGNATCGVPSPLACATGGCNCGGEKNFDQWLGCVYDSTCRGAAGTPCNAEVAGSCQDGFSCCASGNRAPTCVSSSCADFADYQTGCVPSR